MAGRAQLDVLGFGAVAVDEVLCAETYPPPDSKARVLRRERQRGGLAAIALIAAARLGARAAYAGVIGTDDLSSFCIAQMKQEGVDARYLLRREQARAIQSVIIVDSKRGTRNIFYDLAGVQGAGERWPPKKVIQSARVILVDLFGLPGMLRAARIARKSGIPVVADFERDPGGLFPQLLQQVDHLILSDSFARQISGEKTPGGAAKALWTSERQVVAITCGEKGCWFLSRDHPGEPKYQPAFKVPVVDTTGCGDVFHGAYAAALARGLKVPERIRFASAVAALKATKPGAQQGIPGLRQVRRFLGGRERSGL